MTKTTHETEIERAEREATEAYEADANAADEQEYVASKGWVPVDVKAGPVPLSTLAIRLSGTDIERLRERAEREGVGLTQLARTWILERLDADEDIPAEAEEALATLRRTLIRENAASEGAFVKGGVKSFVVKGDPKGAKGGAKG